jgi:hypothetical protein
MYLVFNVFYFYSGVDQKDSGVGRAHLPPPPPLLRPWSQVGATNRPKNIVIRYIVSLALHIFHWFAQIFPRSQPMRESNTST